jgi:hypothetical protein
MAYRIERALYTAASLGAGTVNGSAVDAWDFDQNRCIATLSATLKSGTGALDVKVQVSNDGGATWIDYPSGAFTQLNATGSGVLKIDPAGSRIRAVVTVGGTAVYDVAVHLGGRGDN